MPAAGLGDRDRSALVSASRAVLAALEFRDGISHAEFRLRSGERPVLMEIAARVPGDGITVLLSRHGTPLEPVLLDIALGRPVAYSERGAVRCTATSRSRRECWRRWREPLASSPPGSPTRTAGPHRVPSPPAHRRAPPRCSSPSRAGQARPPVRLRCRAVSVMVDLPLGEPVEPAVSEQAAQVRVRLGTARTAVTRCPPRRRPARAS